MQRLLIVVLMLQCIATTAQQKNGIGPKITILPITRFDTTAGRQTATYNEVIDFWKKLDALSPQVKLFQKGPSDAGYPLHLVIVSADGDFDIASIKRKNKVIILINNGIHPGEPDGIDACMQLAKNIVQKKFILPHQVVLAIIPVYNIGGALNRSTTYRVDQAGPEAFGFRGNSQNLDLNRDFIKCDSKEALSFTKIFHELDPDILIDNHVSNGADYQHVMSLIASQHNKLGGVMGPFMQKEFVPTLYAGMQQRGYDMVPYVNNFTPTPETGWSEFWDSPRYSSGFASLWHTFAFVPETHMLKPYPQRVVATQALMETFIDFAAKNNLQIRALRQQQKNLYRQQKMFPVKWALDSSKHTAINFKGYAAESRPSAVSGLPRLYYNRNKPFDTVVRFFNFYKDTAHIAAPKAYIIPRGWWKVIERLQANGVMMKKLQRDTTLHVQVYRIENYQSTARPYEGHHPNTKTTVSASMQSIAFSAGDWYVPFAQPAYHFLMQTLEPEAEDSYFTWNFFDGVLNQKEHFSDYAFEETAAELLRTNNELRTKLEAKKSTDSAFAKDAYAHLDFVYRQSKYFEKNYLLYPVFRLMQ